MCASCIICTIVGILGPLSGVLRSMLMIFLFKNTTFCACSNAQANTYITVTLFRRLEEKKSEGSNLIKKTKVKSCRDIDK